MALEGLLLCVTHTGKAADSVHISDISDGVDLLASFRKPGAIYVPIPAKGGVSILVYSSTVAVSHASGGICKFVEQGYLTVKFVAGAEFATLLPSILDEGVLLTTKPTSINIVGPGVVATTIGDDVTITVTGGGGGTTDHTALSNLLWTASDHTGTASSLAAFDGTGAASYVTGTAHGDVLYFDGTVWTRLAPGTSGEFLQTTGSGTAPVWAASAGTTDHTALSNIIWTDSDHTGTAGAIAGFDGTGDAAYFSGTTHGDVLYYDGTTWNRLSPGTSGEFLQTAGSGSAPLWASGAGGTNDHALLSANLAWLTSAHTGTAGSLAAFTAGGGTSEVAGTTHGDVLYFNGVDWVRLAPGSTTNNPLVTQTAGSPPTWSSTIAVDTITESTADNGVVINSVRNFGKIAGDPPIGPDPAPLDGDIYYNTTLRMQMQYDGSRSKWLSVDSTKFDFGRSNSIPAGVYFRGVDRQVMSATEGWIAEQDGTVVSIGYTRQDFDAATFDIVESGASIATFASSASSDRDITINADFSADSILAVRSAPGSANTMTRVIGWVRVKWRS
jgi:hypothetical protein